MLPKILVAARSHHYPLRDGAATRSTRFATVEEVANMIVYVCSPLASATNGAALRVDGGVVRSIV
jgi:NAD(P)-dependent dehydrogenase (short-subunit alcohol dehydrogenase family)